MSRRAESETAPDLKHPSADCLDVYCDEAGFTGEHLSNRDQKFFAYASVAIRPEEAEGLVARISKDFGVQGGELKGSRLLKYSRGRRAIEDIVDILADRAQVVVHHKAYALAGKFFEYTFEPLISDISSLFYTVNFHRFVAGVLYLNMFLEHDRAANLSSRFEEAVRVDDTRFRDLLAVHGPDDRDPVEQLISFCIYNRGPILRELERVRDGGGWTLELTLTSLWSLLAHWGDRAASIRVSCDQSVPIRDHQDFINMMVGRKDKAVVELGGRRSSYLFNLAEPISLVESHDSPGVQLADVMAAAARHAFEENRDEWARTLFRRMLAAGSLHDGSMYPDVDYVDIRQKEPCVNYLLLLELVRRSKVGESLINGIPQFLAVAQATYRPLVGQDQEYNISLAPELNRFRADI